MNTLYKCHVVWFIGLGKHSAFQKCVNWGHSFTQLLFFTRMGNLVKFAKMLAVGGYILEKAWRSKSVNVGYMYLIA